MTRKRDRDSEEAKNPPGEHVLAEIPEDEVRAQAGEQGEGTFELVPPQPEDSSAPAGAGEPTNVPAPVPTPERAPSPSQAAEDRPLLPRGGIITMRRSGGLRFTSVTVTVFRDGRVKVEERTIPTLTGKQPARKLGDAELAELYRTLDSANLPGLPPVTGHQNPDAYAYEIAARVGGKTFFTVAFDGSIPPQLGPLVRLLASYARPQDENQEG